MYVNQYQGWCETFLGLSGINAEICKKVFNNTAALFGVLELEASLDSTFRPY